MFYNMPEIVVHYDIISMEQWYDRNWYYLSSRVAAGDLEWGIKVIRLERSAIESICRKYGICCLRNEAIVENRLRPLVLYRTLQATNQYSNINTDIAVRWPKSPHRYWNSRAIWDHTVLPATRQRWHSNGNAQLVVIANDPDAQRADIVRQQSQTVWRNLANTPENNKLMTTCSSTVFPYMSVPHVIRPIIRKHDAIYKTGST